MAEQLPPELLASCDTNHGPMLLVFAWLFLAFAIITVFLRLYFRHFYRNGLHLDDLVMLASLIAGIIAVSWLNVLVNAGLGQHIYCLPPQQIPTAVHASILGQIFNILGIGLVKVSVCLTVLRIIDRAVSPLLKLFIWTLLVFACLSHCAQILLFIIQCRPMRAIWDVSLVREGRAHCFSSHITYLAGYIGFGLDAFTDLACSAIPIVIVNRLHLNPRTKTALCVLMGLGSLTAACAIAKAVTLRGVFADDYTYALTNPAICTILEHLCGMILASLPALRPLVRQLLEGVSSGKRMSSTPPQNHNGNRHDNNYYNRHVAAGGAGQQHRPPALALSPRSNNNNNNNNKKNPNPNNALRDFLPPPPQAPALAVSSPRSPRFAAGGGRVSDNKRRRGSRTSWWAMPAERKSWRKSVAGPKKSGREAEMVQAAPAKKKKMSSFSFGGGRVIAGGGDGNGSGGGMAEGVSHWHRHPLHLQHQHHHRNKTSDHDGMGSQDTTIVGSSSPGTTPGMKDHFSALEKGVVGEWPVKHTSLGPEEDEEEEEAKVTGETTRDTSGEAAAAAAAVGQITRTVSFRLSEHYSDGGDGGGVEAAEGDGGHRHHHHHQTDSRQQGVGSHQQQQQQHEWPLNPLSPVDGVSPWYEDEEGARSPHEDYLRLRGWHRDF